jgi:hypothetical protein
MVLAELSLIYFSGFGYMVDLGSFSLMFCSFFGEIMKSFSND